VVETFRAATLAEALDIRARTGAVPLAGGTDLLVKLSRGAGRLPGFSTPVLFLEGCAGLSGIGEAGGALEIGAMTRLAEIAGSPLVHPALREIVLSIGGPGIRNAATLGGNICNASPAGDTLPFLYAFDAKVRLASPAGERSLPIREFVTGPGRTALRADEIFLRVVVPSWQPAVAYWRKVGTRRANALTKVSIAGFADRAGGRLSRVRIALGAVGPTVIRLTEAERLLEGTAVGTGSAVPADLAAAAARGSVKPIDDQRSTAVYRAEVAGNLVREFALRALRPGTGREA
jgi:CO/xanthine dehydrogenase FAD-binding subunit